MTKDWVHGVGFSPVYQILLQIVVRAVITSSPPAWTSPAGMLSTPAEFRFFNDLYCSLHFFAKDGVDILCVCLRKVQYRWLSIGLVTVKLWAVLCPSVQYRSSICELFSWTILDSSSFLFFHSGQVFHELVYVLLLLLFLRISSISVHCSPI